jgi:hypothetical protein
MSQQIMVHSYNQKCLSSPEEQATDTYNVDGSPKHTKWKKPDSKAFCVIAFIG